MLKAFLADITTQVDYLTHELCRLPLSAQPGTRAGEKPTAALSACFDLLPQDDPPQIPSQTISRPREARLPPSQHNSVDINLPTMPAPLHSHTSTQAAAAARTLVVLTLGRNRPPGGSLYLLHCIPPDHTWPGHTCHQVTPVTRGNASEASSLYHSSPWTLVALTLGQTWPMG